MISSTSTSSSSAPATSASASATTSECTRPLLSVLVPIYNVERYLETCLTSLVTQSYNKFEVLLLNDGSTDASGRIAARFAQTYDFVRLINKKNTGYGATLNEGLGQARGRYIAFLESDDSMYPNALQYLMQHAIKADADIVRGAFSLFWEKQNKALVQHPYPADLIGRTKDLRADLRVFLTRPAIWNGVYKKHLLDDNSIYFLQTPGAAYQDTSFAFKTYAAAQKVLLLDTPVVYYRQDNEISSVRSRGKVYAVCQEFDEIDRWLTHRNNQNFELALRNASFIARYNAYLWNLDRIAQEFQEEFIMHMSKEFSLMDDAGRIDWSLIDDWRALNLRTIMHDPQQYLHTRQRLHGPNPLAKAAFALELGGTGALFAALKERKGRK